MPPETLANPLFLNMSTFSSSPVWFPRSRSPVPTRSARAARGRGSPSAHPLETAIAAVRAWTCSQRVSERIERRIKEILECFVHQITSNA